MSSAVTSRSYGFPSVVLCFHQNRFKNCCQEDEPCVLSRFVVLSVLWSCPAQLTDRPEVSRARSSLSRTLSMATRLYPRMFRYLPHFAVLLPWNHDEEKRKEVPLVACSVEVYMVAGKLLSFCV